MIQATVVLDEAYWRQVYRLFGQPGRIAVPAFGAVLSSAAIYLLIRGDAHPKGDGDFVSLYLLVVGCAIMASPYLAELARRRAIRRKPALGSSLSWTISKEGLSIDGLHVKGTVDWEGFSKVVPRADGLIIYSGKMPVHWIPAAAFASRDEFEAAVRLIPAGKIAKK